MGLRAEAERTGVPATTLAREAVDLWLRQQGRKARHDAVAAYAAEMAGPRLELDAALEFAAIEHILNMNRATRWSEARFIGPILFHDPARSNQVGIP